MTKKEDTKKLVERSFVSLRISSLIDVSKADNFSIGLISMSSRKVYRYIDIEFTTRVNIQLTLA